MKTKSIIARGDTIRTIFIMVIFISMLFLKLKVRAEEIIIEEVEHEEEICIDNMDIDNEELFEDFVYQQFYGDMGVSRYSSIARNRLSGQNAIIYDAIKEQIQKIARGEVESTVIEVPVKEILGGKLRYTAQELGVSVIVSNDNITEDAQSAVFNYNLGAIIKAILVDSPYEMYWYNVVENADVSILYRAEYDLSQGEDVLFFLDGDKLEIKCPVSEDFEGSEEYTIDSEKIKDIPAAVSLAQSIVAQAANLSDEEKLKEYCRKICELASYNWDAAEDRYSSRYGHPWQLIWVFDMNQSTEVVCEGYAKAFQYLCDMTTFNGDVYSYIITGNFAEDNPGDGPHMWNFVHMDDNRNYLVDVTNVDAGLSLFLKPVSGMNSSGVYYFETNNRKFFYSYDADSIRTYSREELTLSTTPYVGGVVHSADVSSWMNDGTEHWHNCVVSGCIEKYDEEDHDFSGEYIVDKIATCSSYGEQYKVCEKCNAKSGIEKIHYDSNNHKGIEETKDVVARTCTQNGYTGDIYCKGCNQVKARGQVLEALGHNWNDGKVILNPTVSEKGLKEYICLNNRAHKKTEDIPTLDVEPTPTAVPSKDPIPTVAPTKEPPPTPAPSEVIGGNGLVLVDNVWSLVKEGKIQTEYSDLYCDEELGWWKVENGIVDFAFTGIYYSESYGWWLVNAGQPAFGYSGLYGDINYGWWLIEGGRVAFEYTGLYGDTNYGWWLVYNGSVAFNYTGIWGDPIYGWWLIGNGQVAFFYDDLWGDSIYGWWKIVGGMIDFGYNGLYRSPTYGSWNISGGTVIF